MTELLPVVGLVVTFLVLLGISAFFSSSETAIFSLSPDWIAERTASGDARAGVLDDLRADPHRLLVTLLVGNNVVNVAISSVATATLLEVLPSGQAVPVATVVVSVVILIFGEIVPKSFGLGNADSWALAVARPIQVVETVTSPLVTVFDRVTRVISAAVGGDVDIEEPYVDE